MSWIESLPTQQRDAAFATMRRIGDRADRAHKAERKLIAPQGTLAVGSAAFDPFIIVAGLREFLRAIRRGLTPVEAEAEAKKWVREAIAFHNAKRPGDGSWERDEIAGDGYIEKARREMEAV